MTYDVVAAAVAFNSINILNETQKRLFLSRYSSF